MNRARSGETEAFGRRTGDLRVSYPKTAQDIRPHPLIVRTRYPTSRGRSLGARVQVSFSPRLYRRARMACHKCASFTRLQDDSSLAITPSLRPVLRANVLQLPCMGIHIYSATEARMSIRILAWLLITLMLLFARPRASATYTAHPTLFFSMYSQAIQRYRHSHPALKGHTSQLS